MTEWYDKKLPEEENVVDDGAHWFSAVIRDIASRASHSLTDFLKPGWRTRKYVRFDETLGEDPVLIHYTKLYEQNPQNEAIKATLIAYKKEHGYD